MAKMGLSMGEVVGPPLDVKVGDVVHVRGTVVEPPLDGALSCDFEGAGRWFVRSDSIVHVEPRPLQVGDRVTYPWKDFTGTILAIGAEHAWIKRSDGVFETHKYDSLFPA